MRGDHKVKTRRPQPKHLDKKAHPKHKDTLTATKGVQTPNFTKNTTKRGAPVKKSNGAKGKTKKAPRVVGRADMGNAAKIWKPFGM